MDDRKQQKFEWIGGWLGGFIWVLILSVIFLFQGRAVQAWVGLVITFGAVIVIWYFSPWKHPRTTFRLLMTPIYVLFFAAIAWAVWAMEDFQSMGINSWWSALILLPVFLPFWTVGTRRWDDNDA